MFHNLSIDEIQSIVNSGSNIGNFVNKKENSALKQKIISCTSFLKNPCITQRLWHIVNNISTPVVCSWCKVGLCKWSQDTKTYRQYCCIKCSRPAAQEKCKQTLLSKYGVDNIQKLPTTRQKVSNTLKQKYGVSWFCGTEKCQTASKDYIQANKKEIGNKRKETNIERYGVGYPAQLDNVKLKTQATNVKRYGVPHSSQNIYTRLKSQQTSLERYGVPYAVQNPEIHELNMIRGRKFKQYVFPSGRVELVQGYEHLALNQLLQHYREDDIVVNRKDMPELWYTHNGKKRRYYPDILIKSVQKIIEVKSHWTYNRNVEVNNLKKQSAIDSGYLFDFMII